LLSVTSQTIRIDTDTGFGGQKEKEKETREVINSLKVGKNKKK